MCSNESKMKIRGEQKTWKTITKKSGDFKNVSSTQVGQKLLLDEGLRVLPLIRKWIDKDSAKVYRLELQGYFKDDEILLEKIIQSYLFLAGSIYHTIGSTSNTGTKSRHKRIRLLQKNVMPEMSFEQTWRFTEVIIDYSQYFDVDKLLEHKKGSFYWNLKYISNLSEVILNEIAIEAAKAFYPLPMTEQPIPWEFENNELKGGYATYQHEMVRAAPRKVDYNLYSKHIFDAVNYIQSTPWVVNEVLLKKVTEDLKIPVKADYIKNEFPSDEDAKWEIDLEDKSLELTRGAISKIKKARQKYKDQSALYKADVSDYESDLGKYRAVKLSTQIAEQYIGQTIYFPHSYDFRGRVYPLPVGLSPQGSDAVKSLLLYKNTEELTEKGIEWNWAYLSSLYGDDKLPFDERVQRGKELLKTDYNEADEPYQFLSHQLELIKWVEDPSYMPNTRIHLDACNSGSQFTSAITGDKKGCMATNVIPTINEDGSQTRQDAYMLVSDKAVELSQDMADETEDEEETETILFLKSLLLNDGRKICKVPVMVSNYGGTPGGRADILWNMLRELGVDRKWITKKTAYLFSRIIGDSIVGVLNGGKAFEVYIHNMNNVIARDNKPVIWTTSDGFHVVHSKNKELRSKQVTCMLPNARSKTTITKKIYSDRVSSIKMKSAISPNYIHSLDAELLRRVSLKMMRQGISDSDWIHDSFGCHPNHVDKMLEITKSEFAKLIRRAPLKVLDKQLRLQAPDDKKSLKELGTIKIPHLRGFSSDDGDLNIVMESDWFFS